MKKAKKQDQAELLRAARQRLGVTNAELAAALGKSEATVLAWLAPRGAEKHRTMPESAKLLLAHLLASKKKSAT